MRKIFHSFKTAAKDARQNLLHTLLSLLGIVIGVGALVSILSLIDGLEKFAEEQITNTTSLESIIIKTPTTARVDGILVQKENPPYFTYDSYLKLCERIPDAKIYLRYRESGVLTVGDSAQRGILFTGVVATWHDALTQLAGRYFSDSDVREKKKVIVISKELAAIYQDSIALDHWMGRSFPYKGINYEVIGVIDLPSDRMEMLVPITLIPENKFKIKPPNTIVVAPSVTEVPKLKEQLAAFLEETFGEESANLDVITNEFRVDQAKKGFLVFRIIMGLIVGISVLVGGIGVMNVLLISVSERTAEIGVRKAVGAKRKDIVVQFLSESLLISSVGSVLGIVLGISFTAAAVPIVKHLTEMPFEAAYTFHTLSIIGMVAMVVGIVFGTYPALKASKLDPVEAIRRE